MAAPYSLDLRERVVAAVAGGMSRKQAAEKCIAKLIQQIDPAECLNYFQEAGYAST